MRKFKYLFAISLLGLVGVGLASCGEEKTTIEIPPVTDLGEGNTPEEIPFVDLTDIEAETTRLHQKQEIQLSGPENVTWSVSNDLATISETGLLKVGEKDGTFVVSATSKEDTSFVVKKKFEVKTMSSKELGDYLYSWAEGYNYTIEWKGRFLDTETGEEITQADIEKDLVPEYGDDAVYIFEDMAIKGNLVKYTNDAFYWKYGQDGYGNPYEGGSYNSPLNGGSVWNYDIIDGKAVQGDPDSYDGWLGYGDYKKLYTSDLSFFMRDEFKVEDSNLVLSEDNSKLLYDATKDNNNFKDKSDYYNDDYSIPITIWGICDSTYAMQFYDYGWDLDTTGEITYDENGFVGKFLYPDIAIGTSKAYDYEITLTISDIGTTVIEGIDDLIAADLASMGE